MQYKFFNLKCLYHRSNLYRIRFLLSPEQICKCIKFWIPVLIFLYLYIYIFFFIGGKWFVLIIARIDFYVHCRPLYRGFYYVNTVILALKWHLYCHTWLSSWCIIFTKIILTNTMYYINICYMLCELYTNVYYSQLNILVYGKVLIDIWELNYFNKLFFNKSFFHAVSTMFSFISNWSPLLCYFFQI